MFQMIHQDMKKRIARKIVNGWAKPRKKRINPTLCVWRNWLTDKLELHKLYYCDIPIYRKWTEKQIARAERRLGIKNEPLLPLKLETMPVELDMKLETINL